MSRAGSALAAVALALASACSDDSPAGSHPIGTGGSGGWGSHDSDVYPRPAAMEEHFRPAVAWAAPALDEGLRRGGVREDWLEGRTAAIRDLDGDGLPDLVVVGEAGATFETAAGRAFRFHRNDGRSGFAAAADWAVPAEVTTYAMAVGGEGWSLLHIDRDGRPDLLVGDGTDRLLYRNAGRGFEANPSSLPFPPPSPSGMYLLDLDGDGRDDVVETGLLGPEANPHWQVYLGTGSGFRETAWPVPEGCPGGGGFDDVAGSHPDACGYYWTAFRDLTGDGRRDLLVTGALAADGTLQVPGWPEHPHWRLFPNHGSGFGAGLELPIAAHPGAGWFATLPSVSFDDDGAATVFDTNGLAAVWTLRDMDGDGRPDLVFTSPGAEVEAPYWSVYRNLGAAFAAPVAWPLPRNPISDEVRYFHEYGTARETCETRPTSCVPYSQHWGLVDLDDDGRADLVEWGTGPAVPGEPETPHLRVYFNR